MKTQQEIARKLSNLMNEQQEYAYLNPNKANINIESIDILFWVLNDFAKTTWFDDSKLQEG